jgi:hypothetical protein
MTCTTFMLTTAFERDSDWDGVTRMAAMLFGSALPIRP